MIRAFFLYLLLMASALASGAEPLRPEDAFRPSARALDGRTVEVSFEIAEGYYLYRDKFQFSVETGPARLGQAVFPKGRETRDETFGTVEVYDRQVSIRLPVERDGAGVLPLTVQLTSQGCAAELGICYPPQKQRIGLELPDPADVLAATAESDESGRIARLFQEAAFGWVLVSFFGFGLLLSATPCTFPMLPILSGLIVGAAGRDGQPVPRGRAFALSLAYVAGMAVVYALAGVAAGLSGTLISGALQNVWVLGGFALIFVALALSMFGLFELRLPARLQGRVTESAARRRGGSLPGVALMGGLSALIVGPCVAAPLAGALLYIGGTGDALLGGLALFCWPWAWACRFWSLVFRPASCCPRPAPGWPSSTGFLA
jgi:thiol:disulfide interchange protein DsbD